MDINVNAAVGLTKGFRQKKVNRAGGSIVFISSVAGLTGQAGHAEYCTSKAALIGLCRAAALELARENIRVNCIAPGVVNTEMLEKAQKTRTLDQLKDIEAHQPLGLGTPRDVSHAVDGGYTAH